jgi:NAD/NADP transhydrogenase alpha subunit
MNRNISKFLRLGKSDFVKGLVVTAGTAAVAVIGKAIEAGRIPTQSDLVFAGKAALSAGAAYLLKNLFTNSSGDIAPEQDK